MTGKGIRLFRAFGVGVFLDYSWFLFFFLVVWTFSHVYFPRQYPSVTWGASMILGVTSALLLFASVVFHELAHAIVSNRLGVPIKRITLFIFGGVAHMTKEPEDPRTEFLVAAAGPLSSLLLWIAFYFVSAVSGGLGLLAVSIVCGVLAGLNLMLALFNLVPGFPLDGGRLVRAALWWKTGSLKRSTSWAAKGGEAFAFLLMCMGVYIIFKSRMSGLVEGIWYILIGVFVKRAAEQSYQHVLIEDVLEGILVGEIMGHNKLSVRAAEPLGAFIEETFIQHKFESYPVIDDAGTVVGVVDLEDVKGVAPADRVQRAVGDVMHAIPAVKLPRPSTKATEALREMLALGLARLPVIDESGHLAGIVTRSDIMSMFRIRTDLGEEVVV